MKLALIIAISLSGSCLAQDATLDWLMNQSTTAPATQPATQPTTSPLTIPSHPAETRKGKITLSDGSVHTGLISTTAQKSLSFWDASIKEYRSIPLTMIATMEARVLWSRDEPEWHFKESGSDIKEFTGRTYPARETEYAVTLVNGQHFTGSVVAPLYLVENGESRQYVLNKRAKGAVGRTLDELIYVARVELTD